jgi:two-component system NtrC family sensor kinase
MRVVLPLSDGRVARESISRFNMMQRPLTLKYMLRFFYRPVLLPAVIGVVLLLLTLGLLLSMSWSSLHQLQPVHSHLKEVNRLHQTGLWLEEVFVDSLSVDTPVDRERLDILRSNVDELLDINNPLVPATPERLQKAQEALSGLTGSEPREVLLAILGELRAVIATEIDAHDRLLVQVEHANQAEFRISMLAIVAFPLLLAAALYLLRNRILVPLHNLGTFMSLLAQRDYSRVPTADVDPLLVPLFQHYNQLVARLAELEQEHQVRQQSLEQEVHTATQTLLGYQRDLANAERLAAVGEVAAGVAHELRNPLAGIQMALSNLRRQLSDHEQVARLDAALKELKRITHLLNEMLEQSRQAPEPVVALDLAKSVEELLGLVRYQIPTPIHVQQDIPAELHCRLPEGRLRQALLNLLVNAAQSIGEQPGMITVSAAREQDTLQIQVTDDGPGFPAELLQGGVRAFATWREGGTGLGLAMVRRFARDLGGDLQLANRTPRGACVTLLLRWGEPHG